MTARIGSRTSTSNRRPSTAGKKDKLTRGAKPPKAHAKHHASAAQHHHKAHHSRGTGSAGSGGFFS